MDSFSGVLLAFLVDSVSTLFRFLTHSQSPPKPLPRGKGVLLARLPEQRPNDVWKRRHPGWGLA